jgi:CDP-glucose 4,6-dehydratase
MTMSAAYWRNRRVFITGHTGFKGAWLALLLQELGARVSGYALTPSSPSLFESARVGEGLTSRLGDVRDLGFLSSSLRESQAEVVIHLAAQALVRPSYAEPAETYAVNVMGTVNVLEAVRRMPGVRAVVVVTSDKCYENQEWCWAYRESDPLGGFDPYSSSKGCAELVTAAYRRSFFPAERYGEHGCAIATARAGNVLGGGDWAVDRLVPDLVRSLLAGQPALVRSPQAVRPWQHVLDVLHGYLLLAERLSTDGPRFAEAWNLGPPDTAVATVAAVADQLVALWGAGATWIDASGPGQPHEATMLRLDAGKARQRLNWVNCYDLNATLRSVVDWTHAHRQGQDMQAVSTTQIRQFVKSTTVADALTLTGPQ